MSPRTNLALVATASFILGVAVDRVSLSAGKSTDDGELNQARGSDRNAQKSPGNTRNHASLEGRNSGSGRDRTDGERAPRVLPASVQEIFEALDRNEPLDFARSSKLIMELPPGPQRREAIHRFASRWGRSDPESALRWAEGLTGHEKFSAMEHVLHQWARNDPAAATEYVAQLPNSERAMHLMRHMTHLWAERDSAAALEWSMAQTNPAIRHHAIGGAVSMWSQGEPAQAAAFAAGIEGHHDRQIALEVAARHWASQDLEEAIEWAGNLPHGDHQRATQSILREVAERDPAHAASVFEELAANFPQDRQADHTYRRMAQEIASIWSSSDPVEAASWAISLPQQGRIQRAAVSDVAERWLHLDRAAASEWITTLPQGETRDGAAERVVHVTAHTEPDLAFAWAQTIGDEGHRMGLMHHSLSRWREVNPAAARSAYEGAEMPPHARRELGKMFGINPDQGPPSQQSQPGPDSP